MFAHGEPMLQITYYIALQRISLCHTNIYDRERESEREPGERMHLTNIDNIILASSSR